MMQWFSKNRFLVTTTLCLCFLFLHLGVLGTEFPENETRITSPTLTHLELTNGSQFEVLDSQMSPGREKRAQGPITELYGCLLTLFLNPLCWNRFENNRLRYLQYLYLRRRLQMMEEAMKKNQTATAEPPRGSEEPEAESSSSNLVKMMMKYFPRMHRKLMRSQKMAQDLQKTLTDGAQRIAGQARQLYQRFRPPPAEGESEPKAQVQAPFSLMMMRT